MQKQSYYFAVGLAALAVGALAVTSQSLWIDEGAAALKAMEVTLPDWWHNLRTEGNSNLQLIGQLFYLWGWEKIFGSSEFALRASNIPFFAGGVLALAWGFSRRRARQNAVVVLALTNAFLWYYVSEARPYIVLFCFASLTAASLFRLFEKGLDEEDNSTWFGLLCTGVIGLCATSLIAVPWALGALGAVLYWKGVRGTTECALRSKIWSGLLIVSLGLLGLYYLWTLRLGARASDVGRTSWTNFCYIFYELFGLAGLGPGRLGLRAGGVIELAPFLPQVVIGAAVVFLFALCGFMACRDRIERRHILCLTISVTLPFVLVMIAGVMGHMRLVGRHLTPLLPYLLALLALGASRMFEESANWRKLLAALAIGVFLFSSLEIRFAPRHQRDDYRSAAAFARQAITSGQRVWWLADMSTGLYYKIPFGNPGVSTTPVGSPDLVILSKPDIYDSSGVARAYLSQHDLKKVKGLPAFQIFAHGSPQSLAPSKSPEKSGE